MKQELCTGCSVCINICPVNAIKMQCNQDGFEYPCIDHAICIQCGLCEKKCPQNSLENYNSNVMNSAYATYITNKEARLHSSSGGVFFAIAHYVICKNGIVFGARYDEEYKVYHCYIDHMKDLTSLMGSKYVQSKMGNCFLEAEKFLKNGRLVLFAATPCQIHGLQSFLSREYKNLICMDMFCHGVPSPMVWQKYLSYRMKKDKMNQLPFRISMRSKVHGWSYYKFSMIFNYKDGSRYIRCNQKDKYMKAFKNDICLRPCCYLCRYKTTAHKSDITVGDYWGVWDQDKSMDDNMGTSILIVQSKKGKKIFDFISDEMSYQPLDISKALKYNPGITKAPSKRRYQLMKKFMKLIRNNSFDYAYNRTRIMLIIIKVYEKILVRIND